MTLQDLWLVICRYAKWVVIASLACGILVGGGKFLLDNVRGVDGPAASKLTVVDLTGIISSIGLSNLVEAAAQDQVQLLNEGDATATLEHDAGSLVFTFTVEAADDQTAISCANSLAQSTAEAAEKTLIAQGEAFVEIAEQSNASGDEGVSIFAEPAISPADRLAAVQSCIFSISEATDNNEPSAGLGSILKFGIVGLIMGLLLSICALLVIDSLRRPIKSEADLKNVSDLPVLGKSSMPQYGERLWMSIRFATGGSVASICIVPLFQKGSELVAEELERVVAKLQGSDISAVRVLGCPPINDSITALSEAHEADVTIVVVKTWEDSQQKLADALEELKNVRARVIGLVLEN